MPLHAVADFSVKPEIVCGVAVIGGRIFRKQSLVIVSVTG
jgi:hypothetical protein